MPLLEMSPNMQELDLTNRKRSHDDYSCDSIKMHDLQETPSLTSTIHPDQNCLLPPSTQNILNSSPHGSPALTEAGSSTPARNSPAPETPTKFTGGIISTQDNISTDAEQLTIRPTANPPAKKKRLTDAERQARQREIEEKKLAREREIEQKKKEREEQAQIRAAVKAKEDEEKAARLKEREDKRKQKEDEDRAKNELREEKKRLEQEKKEKEARKQPSIAGFFTQAKTPKPVCLESPKKRQSPLKPESLKVAEKSLESEYERIFKPFFVKENTLLAKRVPDLDDRTQEIKSQILDDCIAGLRSDAGHLPFNPTQVFALPHAPAQRGKLHQPVKQIIEAMYDEMNSAANGSGSAIESAEKTARKRLRNVPIKVIAFSQDVRPPYCGTLTSRLHALGEAHLRRQARCSTKRLLPLDYDYDSEGEWQEEEGEDIDVDDDEEEIDDEDDMDGFLDDSEDAGLTRRVFANTMEPEITGLCYENEFGKSSSHLTNEYKMEIIHDSVYNEGGINPWTATYWISEHRMEAKSASGGGGGTEKMPPPPRPLDAFASIKASASADSGQPKTVKQELLNDFKRAILNNKALSKVGILDFIFHQFRDQVTRAEVKNTLEMVAEKKKSSGRTKEWNLKPGHEVTS